MSIARYGMESDGMEWHLQVSNRKNKRPLESASASGPSMAYRRVDSSVRRPGFTGSHRQVAATACRVTEKGGGL